MWVNLTGRISSALRMLSTYGTSNFLQKSQRSADVIVPCRTKYIDHRMIRDVKRRKVVKEYAPLRLNLNGMRKCDFLPVKLKETAQTDIAALPTDSCVTKLHARCVLTSRPRGRYKKFRMSRIIWRHLADYNYISGAERAMW